MIILDNMKANDKLKGGILIIMDYVWGIFIIMDYVYFYFKC